MEKGIIMSYKFIKITTHLLVIISLYSCSWFEENTKSPDAPLSNVKEKKYITGLSHMIEGDDCTQIQRQLWMILQEKSFQPYRISKDDTKNSFAIKTNFIEKQGDNNILNMDVYKKGALGSLSLMFSCNEFDKTHINVNGEYCIGQSCKHCETWENCIYHKDLHSQVVELLWDIYKQLY